MILLLHFLVMSALVSFRRAVPVLEIMWFVYTLSTALLPAAALPLFVAQHLAFVGALVLADDEYAPMVAATGP